MLNLPNIISLSRIFLLLPIIGFYEKSFYFIALSIFIIAALTDFLDGYLARLNKQETEIGALLDLLSDKIFVTVILIWLSFNSNSQVIVLSTILIITREITISYVRLHINNTKGKQIGELSADYFGKIKTTSQMFGIGFLLASKILYFPFHMMSVILILLSAIISWLSLINYFKKWNL